ncbi:D-glycerate dehydrogenase [Candidatus Gottesmanbacteria bacterium]|nr:D-glycerate dehydrogenase [Candidatus Gottesmanbacteria bacterium]
MKVFISRPIPDTYHNLLYKPGFKVDIYEKDEICPRKELLKRVRGVDGVISQWEDFIDRGFFEAAGPQLKIVANYATGFDRVDVSEAKKRGIIITNTAFPAFHHSVAEGAIALLMAVAKRTPKLYNNIKEGKAVEFSPNRDLGIALMGKTTGVVGPGNIGGKLAKKMHDGFDNKILYFSRTHKKDLEENIDAKKVSLNKLFSNSDFIFISIPGNESTKDLISREQLSLMKKNAILVSTSAPSVLDEKALVKALKNKKIYGAALDIYSPNVKPLPDDNLILTAATGCSDMDSMQTMAKLCVQNTANVLTGKNPITPVMG